MDHAHFGWGRPGPMALADGTAVDDPLLTKGEYAIVYFNFAANNAKVYAPIEKNPSVAALGVPGLFR